MDVPSWPRRGARAIRSAAERLRSAAGPLEYRLLVLLAQNAGKVLTHRQLLREVWGPGYDQETHMLRVNISNLRRKIELEPNRPRYILTELGVGYRLKVKP